MPFEYTIIDFGDTLREAKKLSKSALRGVNFVPVLEHVLEDMMRIERIIFESEGRRGGGSWAGLKESTKRKKGNDQILRTAGSNPNYGPAPTGANALFKSLTEPGAAYQEVAIDRTELWFGTSRPAAGVQLVGKKNTPARPFMKFLESDIGRWSDWFMEHLMAPFYE